MTLFCRFLSCFYLFFSLIIVLPVFLEGFDEGVKVRFINRFNNSVPGQETTLQVYVTNLRPHPVILVGHLTPPPNWKAVPANDILIHLMPNQNIVQTLVLKIPDYEVEGEFPFSYEVWGRDNPNIYDRDYSTMLVRYPAAIVQSSPFAEEMEEEEDFESECFSGDEASDNESISLSITSEPCVVAVSEETIFISCMLKNKSDKIVKESLSLTVPESWLIVPGNTVDVEVPPNDNNLQIFGVKIPANTPAGRYRLQAQLGNFSLKTPPIIVEIISKIGFKVLIENLQACYSTNRPIDLDLVLLNLGNVPLSVSLEARGDPRCHLRYPQTAITIPADGRCETKMRVEPNLSDDDEKQFILLKVIHSETCEVLYQDTITLKFTPDDDENLDLYIRIPSHVTGIVLGENGDKVAAVEWGGEGIIDPERDRYVEYLFRIPTDSHNVIYSVDQRLYFGIGEPGWDINLGDTVYTLTPLTQRYRYGRGGGFDIEKGKFSCGAHYTQNTYNNDYNPREGCAYMGYNPTEKLYVSGNYLHRTAPHEPTSNIVSIASEYALTDRMDLELEGGKNFLKHAGHHGTYAFRADLFGQIYHDTWFDIEKIYAGSAFFGYYNDVDLLSGIIDFPINFPMRANVGLTHLDQNFDKERGDDEIYYALKQRQRQYSANISYNFLNGSSITFNGLLLRAWDHGDASKYNFNQQWGGFTGNFCYKGWSVVGSVSFGRQEDYLTHNVQPFLQRYWCFASKQLFENLFSSFFVEAGNTNYYDAKPWRNTFGCSFSYRYSANGFADLYLQRVQNKPDRYELNQVTFNLSQTFSNRHNLTASCQYFNYKSHYPNDFLFLVAYTVPFSQPVGRRCDIGNLNGYVHDVARGIPVRDATVNIGGRQCVTDDFGSFAFRNLKSGSHDMRMDVLPKQVVTQTTNLPNVQVVGGKTSQIVIPVIPACSISGEVTLYTYRDPIEAMMNQEYPAADKVIKSRSLAGILIVIDRNDGEESYRALTNEMGTFQFLNLRPGDWTIKVSTENIPKRHYLNMNHLAFSLQPDEHKQLAFDVMPVVLTILPLE